MIKKYLKIGAVALSVASLGACTQADIHNGIITIEQVAAQIEAGVVLTAADTLPLACTVLNQVTVAAVDAAQLGLISLSGVFGQSVTAGQALYASQGCQDAINGNAPANFATLLADIEAAVLAIEHSSNGTVSVARVMKLHKHKHA